MPILDKAAQLQLRRRLRRRQKQTENTVQKVTEHFDKDLIGRFSRLRKVKRFAVGWIGLIALLVLGTLLQTLAMSGAFQTSQPVAGGTYHEGVVGTFSTANPIYALGAVDTAVSRLMFSGLLKYDEDNNYSTDLADSFAVDDTGKVYTIKLKKNIKWHDGQSLSADDIVFTYQLIQNPDTRSPLRASVEGVEIKKIDNLTVEFRLQTALGSFPLSLMTGILPKHILKDVRPSEMRTTSFNTAHPVGSGPFEWKQLQLLSAETDSTAATITLDKFKDFHGGAAELSRFVIHTYDTEDDMSNAFRKREIRAISGMKSAAARYKDDSSAQMYSFQTTAALMIFFNTQSTGPLSSAEVRKAIMLGTNRREIIESLDQTLRIVREPVLRGQFAFDGQYAQPLSNFSLATDELNKAGWVVGEDGIRQKDGKRLTFQLYAEETADNRIITDELKKQWNKLGVDVGVTLQSSMFFQTTLETRSYDAVLHGISIGNDPDVYAYWHSSQIDNGGMNYSNYKSSEADLSLEAGRTRQSDAQRALKYKPFLKAWQADTPAVAMFRPRIYYITRGPVYGLTEHILNTDADRYYSVTKWQINTAMVDNY